MELANLLPLKTERQDMREQWLRRLLKNPLLLATAVMEPFAREELAGAARNGQTVLLSMDQTDLGDRMVGKAMDDRIGCAVLIQTMRELKKTPHDVFFVFTVQEEVGVRGATTSTFGIQPDMAFAVDVTDTGDTPEAGTMSVGLGKGPAIKVKDVGMLAHPGVKNLLVTTAQEARLPYQLEVLTMGSTDAMAMQVTREGVPTGVVSIPTRYVHTPSEMVDWNDVQNSVKLLVSLLGKPIRLE